MIENSDGTFAGKRAAVFDYTNCWVVNVRQFQDEYIPKQILKIKRDGSDRRWFRKDNDHQLYEEDPISEIKGISKKKEADLAQFNITLVKHFINLPKNIRLRILQIKGFGERCLTQAEAFALGALPGANNVVDHRKAANPYRSLYGDLWQREIAKDIRRSGTVCITELIEHMLKERIFRCTSI